MTLTLELPVEIERILEKKARDSGQSMTEYTLQLLAREVGEAQARPRARALLGKYSHLQVSSADVHRERREEVERDEQRYEERSQSSDQRRAA